MAYTLTGRTQLTISGSGDDDSPDLEETTTRLNETYTQSFASGTGNDQINVQYSDTITLAASATVDLDLVASLLDALGKTLTFTKLKVLIVKAAAANTNNVVVSRPAANGVPIFSAANDAVSVTPGGMLVIESPKAGITVTADTGDLITFTNSGAGTGVTFDVILQGVGTRA